MAGREGLEPPTTGSEDQCSIQTELTARYVSCVYKKHYVLLFYGDDN
jgi:hypothetical protein